MENKKPLVKKLTKALIFALCCILLCTPTLTAFATLNDQGWSENGITIDIFGSNLPIVKETVDDWEVFTHLPQATGYPFGSYFSEEWSDNVSKIYEIAPLTTKSYLKIKATTPKNYRIKELTVWSYNYSDHYTVDLSEGFPPTFEIPIWVGAELAIEFEFDATHQGGLEIWLDFDIIVPPGNPGYPGEPDIPDNPDNPDNPDYPDDYLRFMDIIFTPITALHSFVLYDFNGNAPGGEISVGLIFTSILGIWLLCAYLRYFAGG